MANPLLSLAAGAARILPAPLKRALYRLGPLSQGLRRALNQAAPEGFTEIEVAGGPLQGARMQLDLQREKDYWLGTYEIELQQALTTHIESGMMVYDLGANIGYISLMAARLAGDQGQVLAFEALPANQSRLQANLALNPEGQRVELMAAAVAERSGTAHFQVHSSGAMGKLESAAGRQADYSQSIEVPTLALDDVVYQQGRPAPDLVKIDIEGGEAAALAGMARLLVEAHPILLIELHGPEAARGVWQQLQAAGYSLHRMQRGYPQVAQLDELDWKSYLLAKPADD